MNFNKLFHYLSYLQYPLMLTALYYAISPYFMGLDVIKECPELYFDSVNLVLLFMGLGISFSSLQDVTKTQNKFSQRIWESPQKGKIVIVLMSVMIFTLLILGLVGYFNSSKNLLKELSVGIMVLSLGMFGHLKTAIEMFENHRKDKV